MWNNNQTRHDCPHCGVIVFRHEGHDYTPLDRQLLTGKILRDNTDKNDLAFRFAYVFHQCEPETVAAYTALRQRALDGLTLLMAASPHRFDQADLMDAKANADEKVKYLAEMTQKYGLTLECPRCGAGIGEPCENLTERRRGRTAYTVRPHDTRLPYAGTTEATHLETLRAELGDAASFMLKITEALEGERALEKITTLVRGY